MVELKITLTRKVVGEARKFSTVLYLEDEITEEKLKELSFKVTKYLCDKGDILYKGN